MQGHVPVLLKEALALLQIVPGGVYLDATGGMGGHAERILQQLGNDGRLVICDWSAAAAGVLEKRFRDEDRVCVKHTCFTTFFDNVGLSFNGILADLGISSEQLKDPRLGIGFMLADAPLDMRLRDDAPITAAQILETRGENELADIFYHLGGETAARKLARVIVADRREGIFYTTTTALRLLCERVLGKYYRARKIHPATKVFQGLRIAVNDEMTELKNFLAVAPQHLRIHGRVVIISFHSGEDRLVKQQFKELVQTEKFVFPDARLIVPDRTEILINPRARSAKMRVVEKV